MGGPPWPCRSTARCVRGMTHVEVMMEERGDDSGQRTMAWPRRRSKHPAPRPATLPRQRLSSTLLTGGAEKGPSFSYSQRGTFVSLPELVFANIRKGSNDWIPKEHPNLDPVIVLTGQNPRH